MNKYKDPEKEFKRGYNFGKEDGVNQLMARIFSQGGRFKEEFARDSVIVEIPREFFYQLREEASQTA